MPDSTASILSSPASVCTTEVSSSLTNAYSCIKAKILYSCIKEHPVHSTGSSHPHPEHIDLPPAPPTMEEEIMFLKARLIQLELEKREALPVPQASPANSHESKESQPSLVLTPPSTLFTPEQTYPPPPKSPALPPRYPVVSQQQIPSPEAQQYFPPPPPRSPRPQSQIYAPTPEPSYTYNPQSYPQPPPSPNSQQKQYQRQDSGYYSLASTPAASNRLSQSFIPGQAGYPISSQSTGHRRQSPSISSLSQPTPPPYFPPPPGMASGPGKDYFQGVQPPSPNPGINQGHQRQSVYGTQGWQWGATAPVAPGEPNYGSVPVPNAWRGS
jgi:hypothetical protein